MAKKKTAPTRAASRNAFYAQSGGVSAVINASAAGVIDTARKYPRQIGRLYVGRHGIIGALTEDLIDVYKESPAVLKGLKYTPGGCLRLRPLQAQGPGAEQGRVRAPDRSVQGA